jgi:phage terminase large subunit-like protein
VSLSAARLRLVASILSERKAARQKAVNAYDWTALARPEQVPPGEPGAAIPRRNWRYWVIKAGRGWGKTMTGAQTVRAQVAQGRRRNIALVAPTLGDGRKLMIEGPSGILEISPPHERPRWIEKDRELHWPNGAVGHLYSSEEPERARGGNHDFVWCDELGSWRNAEMTWRLIRLATRITGPRGDRPQMVITMTPRPTSLIRALVVNPGTIIQGGSTYDNAKNLDPDFFDAIREEFEGTRLGKQEIEGDLLGDTPGAMFKMSTIEKARVVATPFDLLAVGLAIDPATADVEERRRAAETEIFTAETGIVYAGIGRCLCQNKEAIHGFVLGDLSGYYQPEEWAKVAVDAYHEHQMDRIIAEVNNGGALVGATIRAYASDRPVNYRAVTASRGKAIRAEPIATLYEKLQVHHVGVHARLEDQMTTWNPLLARKSPDRLDANVWVLSDLMLSPFAHRLSKPLPAVAAPRRM